jgi:hypothetical protein
VACDNHGYATFAQMFLTPAPLSVDVVKMLASIFEPMVTMAESKCVAPSCSNTAGFVPSATRTWVSFSAHLFGSRGLTLVSCLWVPGSDPGVLSLGPGQKMRRTLGPCGSEGSCALFGREDLNPQWLDQNQLCYRLHHARARASEPSAVGAVAQREFGD